MNERTTRSTMRYFGTAGMDIYVVDERAIHDSYELEPVPVESGVRSPLRAIGHAIQRGIARIR